MATTATTPRQRPAHLNLSANDEQPLPSVPRRRAQPSSSRHTLDDDDDDEDDAETRLTRQITKPFVPFSMQDIAQRAMARPRSFNHHQDDAVSSNATPWAECDATTHCPDSPNSSTGSSPWSSAPGSPITQPSSCALTPSSSSEGFTLGSSSKPATATATTHAAQTRLDHTRQSRIVTSPISIPVSPQHDIGVTSIPAPLPPRRLPTADDWTPVDFNLKLLFTQAHAGASNSHSSSSSPSSEDHILPPAFFPSQRISFSPRLRITSPEGLPVAALGGMHLGVTGMCEVLDEQNGQVKSKRVIADFCIDLSSGLNIWRRDAQAARTRAGQAPQAEGEESLPPGTYVLPLSMKIPNSDRLPPSFECAQYRIHYTMSIALFSSVKSSTGTPKRLKVFSLPFHILPSTLPTPAPELPVLTHEHKKGMLASLVKTLSSVASPRSPSAENGYHVVFPSLPTSHYSPGAQAVVPVSLRIVDRPLEPTDLYIRLAIVRRTYARESSSTSLATAVEDHWGLAAGVSAAALGYPEDVTLEPWCKSEEEVVSRWGWVPYSSRPGADPTEKAEVVIKDIALPLMLDDNAGWTHGYSNALDLEPTEVPHQQTGECSWFSPAFRTRPPVVKEYGKHVHVSTRFFLSIEVGFASPELARTLVSLGQLSPDMAIPSPNTFTAPRTPSTSSVSGQSLSNPFLSAPKFGAPAGALAFPGKLRELMIPLTIGSVAEPTLACIVSPPSSAPASSTAAEREAAARRTERAQREERGESTSREMGEGDDGAWLCAPPTYDDACLTAPYVG